MFGPHKVWRLFAWLDAPRAVRAGRPLPDYLRDRLAIAHAHAPITGQPPYGLVIDSDGAVTRVSDPSGAEASDSPADADLRQRRGTAAAELILRRGYAASEELSGHDRQFRALANDLNEVRERERAFMER